MSAAEDLYATLGVPRDAAPADIHAAYRRAAKRAHPDAGGTREAFDEIQRANLVLADPKRRERYDRTGHADEKADTLESGALQAISQLLREALMAERDPASYDVVQFLRDRLRKDIDQLRMVTFATKVTIAKADQMNKRLHGKGVAIVARLLQEHRRAMEAALADGEGKLDRRKRALEILADVSFDVDRLATTATFGDIRVADPFVNLKGV